MDHIEHVSEITQGPRTFDGKKRGKLKTILKKDLEIKRMQVNGEKFIQIKANPYLRQTTFPQ